MEAVIRETEKRLAARLGAVLIDRETDKIWQHRPDERFAMCSTFKAIAAAGVLHKVDRGELELETSVPIRKADIVRHSPRIEKVIGGRLTYAELCEAAVTLSDNAAANLLLRALGGPAGMTEYFRILGDSVSRLDRWEPEMSEAKPEDPRDTTTPMALATNIEKAVYGDILAESSRTRLANWLVANRTGDARVRAGVPSGWVVGDKTGSGGFGTTNDAGFLERQGKKPILFAIMMTETKAPLAERNAGMAQIARALVEAVA